MNNAREGAPLPVVLIDLDGTLHDSSTSWKKACKEAVNAMMRAGLGASTEEQALSRLERVYRENPNSDRHIQLLAKHYLEEQYRGKELGMTMAKVVSAGASALTKTLHDRRVFRPFPDAIRFLDFLKQLGVPYYIVTDGFPARQWSKLHRLGLAEFFEPNQVICTDRGVNPFHASEFSHLHFLYDPKTRRKDVAFYRKVLRDVGVGPGAGSSAIMVGDREASDILPAIAAGIDTTIRVDRPKGKYSGGETKATFRVSSLDGAKRVIGGRVARQAALRSN